MMFTFWNLFTAVLEKDGHSVNYQQISDWNTVEIYVNGEQVFKCDIQDLDYSKWFRFIEQWLHEAVAFFKTIANWKQSIIG